MAITPGGRVGDASPLGKGRRRLTDYEREIAHALIRKGHVRPQVMAGALKSKVESAALRKGSGRRLANSAVESSSMSVDLAQLTTAARKRLPKGTFAIPSQRAYPIPDKAHARNALSRVAQHGTPAQKKQVKRAVKRKFPDIGAANRDTAIKLAYALKEARARGMSLDMSAVQRYRHGWIPIGGEVAKAAKRGSVESRYPNANKGLVGDVNTGKLRKAKSPPKVKKLPPGIKGSLSTRKPRAPRGTHSVAGVKMHTELNSNR